ncbi:MAG: hypothetical protein MUF85_01040 [Patescibacteria group bacterium]|jgi:hypothetical protein|nr:hypothetical protein [Patescibacteria group bacterium]
MQINSTDYNDNKFNFSQKRLKIVSRGVELLTASLKNQGKDKHTLNISNNTTSSDYINLQTSLAASSASGTVKLVGTVEPAGLSRHSLTGKIKSLFVSPVQNTDKTKIAS